MKTVRKFKLLKYLILIALIIGFTMSFSSNAFSDIETAIFQGYTLKPTPEWKLGVLEGWNENDWIPFRVKFTEFDPRVRSINLEHDYMWLSTGVVGFDSTGNFYIGNENGDTVAGATVSPKTPIYRMLRGVLVLQQTVDITLPTGGPYYLYWKAHLATGSSKWGDTYIKSHTTANCAQYVYVKPEDPGSSISGYKWKDLDGDGIWDSVEPPLSGWTIVLDGTDISGNPIHRQTTTDSNGYYKFINLPHGTYTVSEVLQSGWIQTAPNPIPPGAHTVSITQDSSNITGKNFGNALGSISGYKYNDLNGNGKWDSGEPGLGGWKIILEGPVHKEVFTNPDGSYKFDDLSRGTYKISEELKGGWTQTQPGGGNVIIMNESTSIYPPPPPPIGSSNYYTVKIPEDGLKITDKDFGNKEVPPPGKISGHKYNDLNGNGKWDQDQGESGLGGWKIILEGPVHKEVITDPSGYYKFTNLPAGTYTISEELQADWIQTAPSGGTYSIPVVSGTDSQNNNFGNTRTPLPGKISGHKYNDLNGNGKWDQGELGLNGWKINLTGPVSGSATTNSSGYYEFTNLTVGVYTVSEELQAGWKQTAPSGGTHSVNIQSGTDAKDKDFGNFKLGKISGYKWNDLDGDGVWDSGELPLNGWKINLTGPVSGSTTTDSNGYYKFTDLTAGDYTVSEELQAGWKQTAPSGGTYTIPVTSGTDSQNNNFGNFKLGKISGYKWNDLDGDGIWDSGEPPLGGWKINLTGPVSGSATTNASGYYEFTNLTVGTYTVSEVLQPGWIQTAPKPIPPGTYSIPVTSGTDARDKNFGNREKPSTISGFKYHDLNSNGRRDPGELGLGGWTIKLDGTDIGGNPVHKVAITNSIGFYQFDGLARGNYTVSEVYQNGWLQTEPTPPGTYTVIINQAGLNITDKNFGNRKWIWCSSGTFPKTIGYWKNWKNHDYSLAEMREFVSKIDEMSNIFNGISVDDLPTLLSPNITPNWKCQLLAVYLNVVSGRLKMDTLVFVYRINNPAATTLFGSITTVGDVLTKIENNYTGWSNAQLTTAGVVLDNINQDIYSNIILNP